MAQKQCKTCGKHGHTSRRTCEFCQNNFPAKLSDSIAPIAVVIAALGVGYYVLSGEGAEATAAQRTQASSSPQSSAELAELRLQRLAREEVGRLIKDPSSAEFKSQNGSCGEVNSKNAFGAYTGFQRFIAGKGMVFLENESEISPREFQDVWLAACQ